MGGRLQPDAELAGPGVSGSGTEIVNMFYSLWQDAFPDNQVRPVAIFADGDTAIMQAVFECTHTETFNAPNQPIPATGKRVSIPYVLLTRWGGGKTTNFTLYFDRVELLSQLGVMPVPA